MMGKSLLGRLPVRVQARTPFDDWVSDGPPLDAAALEQHRRDTQPWLGPQGVLQEAWDNWGNRGAAAVQAAPAAIDLALTRPAETQAGLARAVINAAVYPYTEFQSALSHAYAGADRNTLTKDAMGMALGLGGAGYGASKLTGDVKGASGAGMFAGSARQWMSPEKQAIAESQGFRLDAPVFHGTGADIKAFDQSLLGSQSGSPAARQGVAAAIDPGLAGHYAETSAKGLPSGAANVLPLVYRAEKQARLTLDGAERDHEIAATLAHSWDQGYDAVRMNNYSAGHGLPPSSVVFVKHPNQLRSPTAAFDPAKRDSSDLLASNAAGVPAHGQHQNDVLARALADLSRRFRASTTPSGDSR